MVLGSKEVKKVRGGLSHLQLQVFCVKFIGDLTITTDLLQDYLLNYLEP